MPGSRKPREEVGGAPATHVVAPLDANPIALLISSLALRSHLGATRVVFHVLAAEPKVKMPNRLADCLASHTLDVDLAKAIGARIDPVEMGLSSQLRDAAERAGNAERLILDISGAGPELAVRASGNARELWPAGFRVASHEARRNPTPIWPEPRPKGHRDELVRLEIGSSEGLGAGRATAGEMLALYGLRLEPETPARRPRETASVWRRCCAASLASCKNDFNEGHIFRHLDRLRAIVAEFGEASVRPVQISTEPLKPLVLDRCAAYEIGTLSGNDLLSRLETDLGSSDRPHRTLNATLRVGWQAPAPRQS